MTRPVSGETVFRCFRIDERQGVVTGELVSMTLEELPQGDVLVQNEYSGINYKDALAATGLGKVVRSFPLVGGIDVAGTVVDSADERFSPGDRVVVTGCGLGERHHGGFSEYTRVPGEWVIPLPHGLSAQQSMAFGTAGFSAALAVEAMERNGQKPASGPVLVTGGSGGVGSCAIGLLRRLGYEVVALTGRASAEGQLLKLGADRVLLRQDLAMGDRPLETTQFAGAIDSLGGEYLSWLTRVVGAGGNIAAIGLAAGAQLETTVMPFILRGINLLGIDSVHVDRGVRLRVWQRIADHVNSAGNQPLISRTVGLEDLPAELAGYIDRSDAGRILVRLGGD